MAGATESCLSLMCLHILGEHCLHLSFVVDRRKVESKNFLEVRVLACTVSEEV